MTKSRWTATSRIVATGPRANGSHIHRRHPGWQPQTIHVYTAVTRTRHTLENGHNRRHAATGYGVGRTKKRWALTTRPTLRPLSLSVLHACIHTFITIYTRHGRALTRASVRQSRRARVTAVGKHQSLRIPLYLARTCLGGRRVFHLHRHPISKAVSGLNV